MDARAHEGAPIFDTLDEVEFVLDRGARACAETSAVCLAWAVLENHFHLLLRCEGPPGPTLARLNTSLAIRTRRRREDRGSVFQGRFYSDPCRDESALLARFAYVVGNPLRHGIVPDIDALVASRRTCLGELLGHRTPVWTDTAAALALLGTSESSARRGIVESILARRDAWRAARDADRGEPLPSAFAQQEGELTADGDAHDPAPDDPTSPRDWTVPGIVDYACRRVSADPARVALGRRTPPEAAARAIAAHLACDVAGLRCADVAEALGVSAAGVERARRRARPGGPLHTGAAPK